MKSIPLWRRRILPVFCDLMMSDTEARPPVSLLSLAGRLLGPLPRPLLQPPLSAAMRLMANRHRDVFARMTEFADAVFLIDPTDLPFNLALRLDARAPVLRIATDADAARAAARIQGPLAQLIALLEGRIDGDALFFSRQLVVEGDTEAIVALRNAVDGADIDLRAELIRTAGPFAGIAAAALRQLEQAYDRANATLATLQDAVLEPVRRDLDRQREDLDALRSEITHSKAGRPVRSRAGFVS